MRRLRLTARARLTIVFAALFAVGGTILLVITYVLVAQNVSVADINSPSSDAAFQKACANVATSTRPLDENLKFKCATSVKLGAAAAANAQRRAMLDDLLFYAAITLVATTVVAAFVGWLIAGRILRPVHRLTEAARNASENNLSQRLDLSGPHDELRELGDTFDAMLDRLEFAFVAQRRFIANASHELRTPLTIMRTTLDVVLAKRSPSNAELVEMGEDVRAEVANADALITTLLALAQNEGTIRSPEPVELGAVVDGVVERSDFGTLSHEERVEATTIDGDRLLLERLVSNLVSNAIRYNVPHGDVRIELSTSDGFATLRVINTGAPVSTDRVGDIFQPFTRLDERVGTEGFGLGLALVETIATAHRGTVGATALERGGLEVVVRLPAASATAASDPPADAAIAELSQA
ncbi:HAMP domain-containing protein [Diaminobutyricibacter tongyongensis]|uniref:histidine kinase n=1 Tax=Leifsonia tongyongensis TaxID=1268043 RepID=A0A6L9Y033_9MICO|nr:HAMP domain-containing protein [Diaminobutyricibacter tongyongensis]